MSTVRDIRSTRPRFLRSWAIWTVGFLAFPIGGFVASVIAGRIDSPRAAVIGGAIAGLAVGAGQALASRGRLDWRWWIPATTVGMALGLLLGAAVVGYGSSLSDLAVMGALTGLPLGVAQTVALPRRARRRWAWAAAMPALWALGWTVTTLAGIAVSEQFVIFGALGALTFAALSGLLLHFLLPRSDWPPSTHSAAAAQPSGWSTAAVLAQPATRAPGRAAAGASGNSAGSEHLVPPRLV